MITLRKSNVVEETYAEYIDRLNEARERYSGSDKRKEYLKQYNTLIRACLNLSNGFVPQNIIEGIDSLPDEVIDNIKSSEWELGSLEDLRELKYMVLKLENTNFLRWDICCSTDYLPFLCDTRVLIKCEFGYHVLCSQKDIRNKLIKTDIPFEMDTMRDGYLNIC